VEIRHRHRLFPRAKFLPVPIEYLPPIAHFFVVSCVPDCIPPPRLLIPKKIITVKQTLGENIRLDLGGRPSHTPAILGRVAGYD